MADIFPSEWPTVDEWPVLAEGHPCGFSTGELEVMATVRAVCRAVTRQAERLRENELRAKFRMPPL